MIKNFQSNEFSARGFLHRLRSAAMVVTGLFAAHHASAQLFSPGNLLVSRSVYAGNDSLVTIGQALPGGGNATANGNYTTVWNNETPDPSFGITSPIFLDQLAPNGTFINSLAINTSQLVTSFPSKSELGLSVSSDGTAVTFMGYVAPVNTLDVSNSNTPGHVDPTNPVALTYQRAVGEIDANGNLLVTPVNTYSGNNGRTAVLAANVNGSGQSNYYMVGNAGNGAGTEPVNIVNNTGLQMTPRLGGANATVVGVQQGVANASNGFQFGYSVVQNSLPADKSGKDNNFRGLTLANNTLFATKGSGSNGIDTVYQIGTAGTLPTAATAATTAITVLPGFNSTSAKTAISNANPASNPFGLFFANSTTLYVADEGDAVLADLTNGNDPNAGLQKWIFNGTVWNLAYTLKNGLNLGANYSVGNVSNLQTDGLRNITGEVYANGTVSLFAVTAAIGGLNDPGANPNFLMGITDNLSANLSSEVSSEQFVTIDSAMAGEVLRGVSFTPSTAVPEPATFALLMGAGVLGLAARRRMRPLRQ